MEKICKICSKSYIGKKGTNICDDCKEIKKQKRLEKNRLYKSINKNKIELQQKGYRERNKEKRRAYLNKNNYKISLKSKEYKIKNSESIKLQRKEYRKNNRDKINKYMNEKMKKDNLFKLSHSIRTLINSAIRNTHLIKVKRTEEILGCNFIYFKIHIEGLFLPGMCWENHGKWHLDHIIPISWAMTEEEIYKLSHYTNFQPLWAEDNFIKNNRFSG